MNTSLICSRVVVIGESNVGKTSILNKLANDNFNINELPTIGSNYQTYVHQIQGVKIELEIWDTAGQERFRALGTLSYRGANAALIVYDQTKKDTFESLEMWIKTFTDCVGDGKVIFIVANKSDLPVKDEGINYEEAENWAASKNYRIYQTSARSGQGIKELFADLAKSILDLHMSNASVVQTQSKKINESNQQESCC